MKYKQINKQNIWAEKLTKKNFLNTPCLFLDRDGVLIDWKNSLMKINEAKIIKGCEKIIKECNKKEIPVILITNQGGVGLGLHTWKDFFLTQKKLLNLLLKKNAKIDGVIACAHHPYAKGRFQHQNHPCRKPNGGMFLIAKKLFNLDLENSWMIGDKINDLKAAFSKGLKGGFLVMTGYGKEEEEKLNQVPRKNFIVKIASSINKVKIIF
mgnify:FL=1